MTTKKAYPGCSATSAEKNHFTISGRPQAQVGVTKPITSDQERRPSRPLDTPRLVTQGAGNPLGHVLAVSRRGEVIDHLPTPRFLDFARLHILRHRGVAAGRILLSSHSMRGLAWARDPRDVAMRAALPYRVPAKVRETRCHQSHKNRPGHNSPDRGKN